MITLDLQSFRQSETGTSITGIIFINLHDGPFPESGWTDLPIALLSMWTEALLQLEAPNRFNTDWYFMDGPYKARLTKETNPATPDTFDLAHLRACLIETAEQAIAHCAHHKIVNPDLVSLRDHIRRLKESQRPNQTNPPCLIQITRHRR
jgi:hypothetical protein